MSRFMTPCLHGCFSVMN